MVDTPGFILGVLVTPANVSDPAGAAMLLPEVVARFGWLRLFWADSTYAGLGILKTLRAWFPWRGLRMEIVRAREGVKGFAVQRKRWLIERTFAWLTHNPAVGPRLRRARGQQRSHDPHRHVKTHGQTIGETALLDSLQGEYVKSTFGQEINQELRTVRACSLLDKGGYDGIGEVAFEAVPTFDLAGASVGVRVPRTPAGYRRGGCGWLAYSARRSARRGRPV